MSFVRLYRYREKVILPTVLQAEQGFYIDTAPVAVCDTADDAQLRIDIGKALNQMNPVVPTPASSEEPGSAVLEALGLRKWRTFEAESVMLSIYITDKGIEYYSTGWPVDGEWKSGHGKHISLPVDTILEKLIDLILRELHDQPAPDSQTVKGGLMLLPPPAAD